MITEIQKNLLLEKLCPLGRVPKYINGEICFSDTSTRRFIHDGCFVDRSPRGSCLADKNLYNPEYLGFGINESISVIMQDDYELYSMLFGLFKKFDKIAADYISVCEQAAVLFNHKSFGIKLFPHIHQRSDIAKPSISFFYNLTNTNTSLPVLTFLEPVFHGDREFEKGYTNHKLLFLHERNSKKKDIPIDNGSVVVFDAQFVPHSFSFTDDIWLVFVYDNVILKPSVPDNFIRLFDSTSEYNVFTIAT